MKRTLYFSFGSNLCDAQMRHRCPAATMVGPATLEGHQLLFRGYSARWGGSVATVRRAAGARVRGVLYALTAADVKALDRYEGAPCAYERVIRFVRCPDGHRRRVHTYVMAKPASRLVCRPGALYFAQIWCAYARLGFDRASLNEAFEATR